ncbi:transcriptional regulator with XRE-family HTH domain [Aminobacter niigataensis]|uniref:Transcriptional regulator with XRE-family HTH domain n=1 Tax=Aminobacter niigataensis TaxID=83265 RepID=A0ABR6KXL3_9HYPH|nr:helix-turn-helix transcriptional regulator [Aminobacter niigataensis]MBB4649264.1 transcriptional regulator with XRE-family HTH domain [Aminobacter niigataensis]
MLGFEDIELRRDAARIEQKELCERAGVHLQTYSRLKNRPGSLGATTRTLKKLKSALDELIGERVQALISEGASDGKSN